MKINELKCPSKRRGFHTAQVTRSAKSHAFFTGLYNNPSEQTILVAIPRIQA